MPWITKEGRTVEEAQEAAVGAAGLPPEDLEIEVVSEGAKGLFGLGGEPAIVRVRPRSEATDFRSAFHDDITPVREDERPAAAPPVAAQPAPPPAPQVTEAAPAPEVTEAAPAPQAPPDEPVEERMPLTQQQEEAERVGVEIVNGILERMGLEGEVTTRVAGGTVYIEIFGDEMGILIGRGGATLEALQEVVRAGVQRRLHTRQAVVVDIEAYWERRRRGRGRQTDPNRRPSGERRGRRGQQGSR